MKLLTIIILTTLFFVTTTTAIAGTATGSTTLLGTPVSKSLVNVDVTVITAAPVVAFEYSLQTECYFSGKLSGQADSYQRDDIVQWVFSEPPPNGNIPHATMTIDLTSIPVGAACKTYIVKGNPVIKGSTTTFTVE